MTERNEPIQRSRRRASVAHHPRGARRRRLWRRRRAGVSAGRVHADGLRRRPARDHAGGDLRVPRWVVGARRSHDNTRGSEVTSDAANCPADRSDDVDASATAARRLRRDERDRWRHGGCLIQRWSGVHRGSPRYRCARGWYRVRRRLGDRDDGQPRARAGSCTADGSPRRGHRPRRASPALRGGRWDRCRFGLDQLRLGKCAS